MDIIIYLTLAIFIIIILIEEFLKDFATIRIGVYGILLGIFLECIKVYLPISISIYFNYLALIVFIATPLFIIYDYISKRI
jgi:hypothetical protein